jgi:hypothetical protein
VSTVALLIALSTWQPLPVADVVEINRFGPMERQQVILYRWRAEPGRTGYRVSQWWLTDGEPIVTRSGKGWQVESNGYRVQANRVRYTETQHDPEVLDRKIFPECQRVRLVSAQGE